MSISSAVTAIAPAASDAALAHFESSLRFETDCADVYDAFVVKGQRDFVLLDVRSPAFCAGPHCNGATRGAIRLARLGRPVKVMIGGVTGWLDEGFALTTEPAGASAAPGTDVTKPGASPTFA
jgi:hypothetical protein